MSKDKLYLDMPDEVTMEVKINTIVSKGVRPKESFYSYLKGMYNAIGLRFLFYDGLEFIFISLLIFFALMALVMGYRSEKDGVIYVLLFAVAPVMYLVMSLFAFIRAEQNGTYEIEMTCKYDMYQKSAFRMLVFSILCILFNTLLVLATVSIHQGIDFLRAFMITVTSLFLFAAFFLIIVARFNSSWTKQLIIAGWLSVNVGLGILGVEIYSNLLTHVSLYVYFAVTAISIYVYMLRLKQVINYGLVPK